MRMILFSLNLNKCNSFYYLSFFVKLYRQPRHPPLRWRLREARDHNTDSPSHESLHAKGLNHGRKSAFSLFKYKRPADLFHNLFDWN